MNLLVLFAMFLFPILGLTVSAADSELPNNFWDLYAAWEKNEVYPEFFGGVYYNNNRNLCVVLLDSSDSNERNQFIEKYKKSVTFTEGKYSYAYLKSLCNEITDSLSVSPEQEHICGIGLNVSGNCVDLTVEPCIFDSVVREYSERYGDAVSVKTGARSVALPGTERNPVLLIAASAAIGAVLLAAAAAIYQITVGKKKKATQKNT